MEEEDESVHLPMIHRHPLRRCLASHLLCRMCHSEPISSGVEAYICTTCNEGRFHKECAESPLTELKHSYHPPHSLSLRPVDIGHGEDLELCSCCGETLRRGWVSHCSICRFSMHLRCAMEPPLLHVDHPKTHEHKLFLLPKPRPFACDACGLTLSSSSLPYACLQCGLLMHKNCIDLPRVVRISRHHHRLCYLPSPPLSHDAWSCGVCRRVVHSDYGAYSCSRGCGYVVHSKCATRGDVWDGKDLYGEPEEPEDVEAPFDVLNGKAIRHFSHEHRLELNENDSGAGFDGSEHCRACALPVRIHLDSIYGCTQRDCGFVLHETCANLPRKTWYMRHPHRLKLETVATNSTTCCVCWRRCCGFMYTCCEERCGFRVDPSCALVSEPFVHNGHTHPLFSISMSTFGQACSGCKRTGVDQMQCIECDFGLCFRCITSPSKVRYKQDKHPLVLVGGGEDHDKVANFWWCEICERKMDPQELLYSCDRCCVTVHVHCILGVDPHMKPGLGYFDGMVGEFDVVSNNSCCRPLCHRCLVRCPFPIVYKRDDHRFCSFSCLFDNVNNRGNMS